MLPELKYYFLLKKVLLTPNLLNVSISVLYTAVYKKAIAYFEAEEGKVRKRLTGQEVIGKHRV